MFLMPAFDRLGPVVLVHFLVALRQTHVIRFRVRFDAYQGLWGLEFRRVNGRRKRVQQLGPSLVIQPQHTRTLGTKIPLGRRDPFVWSISIHDSLVNTDMLLAFDLQRIGVGSKINGAPCTPNLAADRTNAQLVRYGCA